MMRYSISNTWPTIALAIALIVLLSYRDVAWYLDDKRVWWGLFLTVLALFIISFGFWRD